jgi:hypothetical protein
MPEDLETWRSFYGIAEAPTGYYSQPDALSRFSLPRRRPPVHSFDVRIEDHMRATVNTSAPRWAPLVLALRNGFFHRGGSHEAADGHRSSPDGLASTPLMPTTSATDGLKASAAPLGQPKGPASPVLHVVAIVSPPRAHMIALRSRAVNPACPGGGKWSAAPQAAVPKREPVPNRFSISLCLTHLHVFRVVAGQMRPHPFLDVSGPYRSGCGFAGRELERRDIASPRREIDCAGVFQELCEDDCARKGLTDDNCAVAAQHDRGVLAECAGDTGGSVVTADELGVRPQGWPGGEVGTVAIKRPGCPAEH